MENIEGRTLDGYHVLEKVGQGGMTSVYKALDLGRSQVVAIKVLSPYIAQDPSFKARFEREIEVLLKVRHEHIVPILDYGEDDPYAFIVMPFYAAGTLQDRLRQGELSPYEARELMEDITAALALAHEQGVIHRDVKPSNILLTEDGRALLSDFGFAHVRELSHS
ncbi:MAG: serine/threonine-protein kinase, partial [Anaerolineales bacterium]|nr:serine/threonine-protein kinase [Anaerolineales bacterium]